MLQLNFRQLQVFLHVAELGSVSRAAEKLGTSQPQVSRTIGDIERRLGETLFFRTAEGLELTPSGSLLKRFASQMIQLLHEAESELHDNIGLPACPLLLGVMPSLASYAAVGARAFSEEYPDLPIQLRQETGHSLLELVQRQRVALGLVVGFSDFIPHSMELHLLGKQRWGLFTRPEDRKRPLEDLNLVLPLEESWERLVLESRVELPQLQIEAVATGGKIICELARQGFAAFLPFHCAATGLELHPAVEPIDFEVMAVRLENSRYPLSSRAFLRLLSSFDPAEF